MKRVVWLTGATYRGQTIPVGGLPQLDQANFDLLAPLAPALGLEFVIARWDAPDLAAMDADLFLVRSAWDYVERLEEFLAAMEALEQAGAQLRNPAGALRWNAEKTYLRAMAEAGAPTIPTVWADRLTPALVEDAFERLDAQEIVLKPAIGAGSRDTIRMSRGAHVAGVLARGAPPGAAMIQPYLARIAEAGELSLFFFGGRRAYAVRKRPGAGDWLANVNGARFEGAEASEAAWRTAETCLAAAQALCGARLLYARVDLVEDDDGALRMIEIEMIEPHLFLPQAPGGARVFLEALAAEIG